MEIKKISKSYSNRVLFHDISFSIDTGIVSLIGKSGTGKSTFLKVIMKEIKPDCGNILYTRDDFAFSYAGCERDSLIADLNFIENYKSLFGTDVFNAVAKQLICLLDFGSLLKKRVIELSGGEHLKASLIIALSKEVDFYCLDEPFQGMDEQSKKGLISFLNEFSKRHLVFLALHELEHDALVSNVIVDFNQQGKITGFSKSESEDKPKSVRRITKTKTIPTKAFFQSTTLYSILLLIIIAFSLFSLSTALSFTEFRSKQESMFLSLDHDSFSYHAVSFSKKTTDFDTLPNELLDKGVFSYSFSLNGIASYLFPLMNDEGIIQCAGERKYKYLSYIAEDGSKIVRDIRYTKEVSRFDSFLFSTIYDEKEKGNIFICSKGMLDTILLSVTSKIDDYDIVPSVYFALDEKGNGNFYFDLPTSNVKISKEDKVLLPFRSSNSICLKTGGKGIGFPSLAAYSDDSYVHIGLRQYQMLLLLAGSSKIFFGKQEVKEIIEKYPDLRIENIIYDYARDNKIRVAMFILFFVSLGSLIILMLFSEKIMKGWQKNIYDFYKLNCLEKYKRKDILVMTSVIIVPTFLIMLFSYFTWMIPVSNMLLAKYYFPYYSNLMRHYPERYGGTIPYLHIAWEGIIFLILYFIALFVILYFLFERKADSREKQIEK